MPIHGTGDSDQNRCEEPMIKDFFRSLFQRLSSLIRRNNHEDNGQDVGPSDFYGLSNNPFSGVADFRCLFLSQSNRKARDAILSGIEEGKEFLSIVGEPGTGKTFLVHHLTGILSASTKTAVFPYPAHPTIKEEIQKRMTELDRGSSAIKEGETQKPNVFFVDEAQSLTQEILESILEISERPGKPQIQWVFSGHPEFERRLAGRLGSNGLVRVRISHLNEKESAEYIAHYLEVAGKKISDLFTSGALRSICRHAGGIPMNINFLCGNALWIGCRGSRGKINVSTVRQAVSRMYLPQPPPSVFRPKVEPFRALSYALASGLLVSMNGLVALTRGPVNHRDSKNRAHSNARISRRRSDPSRRRAKGNLSLGRRRKDD